MRCVSSMCKVVCLPPPLSFSAGRGQGAFLATYLQHLDTRLCDQHTCLPTYLSIYLHTIRSRC